MKSLALFLLLAIPASSSSIRASLLNKVMAGHTADSFAKASIQQVSELHEFSAEALYMHAHAEAARVDIHGIRKRTFWTIGKKGESCSSVCTSRGETCDAHEQGKRQQK